MTLTAEERARSEAFGSEYRRGLEPALRKIEQAVCGCAFGSTAWTTREEADEIVDALGLGPGTNLLEIGAGAGWPSLYLARQSGCYAVLTDLPLAGLAIALDRAGTEGVAGNSNVACADGGHLPFADRSFDAINHSDVLCCLVDKRAVLSECRRVLRKDGAMAFSVIYIPQGLSTEDHRLARETAPEFVDADADYPTLLRETGWRLVERRDLTAEFSANCIKRLRLETAAKTQLRPLVGPADFDARHDKFRRRIPVLERGHLRRELFLAVPDD